MAVQLSELRTLFYGILREEEDTSAYSYTLCDRMLNSAQQKICSGLVVNPMTKEEQKKGQLPFLNTDKFYSSVKTTSLTADTTVGATELNAVTTGFESSGQLYIQGNIITYTGVSGTQFTGVTGVLFAFSAGDQISQCYTLPTDFMSAINVVYNNKFQLPYKTYDDIYEDLNQYKGSYYGRNSANAIYDNPNRIKPFYTIKDGDYIVLFNLDASSKIIRLRYEAIPTEMTLATDTTVIDNDVYAKNVIPYLAVGEMLYNRGEEARAADIINFAMGQLKEMYTFYNKQSYESPNGKQYGMSKSRINL